jgi:predicted ATPase
MPEWEYLGKALDEAQGDRGSLAFVTGEAGIGKSRLLAELCEVARQRGFRVLSGRAVDTGTPVTFRPLFEALSGWFRHGGPPQEPHLDVIRAALAQLVPEWRRPGETPYRASPVELGEALLRLLTHIAAGHGCVLVLEDLHWADLDTVAVLEYLGDNLAAAPVLCLATLRSESATPGVSGGAGAGGTALRSHPGAAQTLLRGTRADDPAVPSYGGAAGRRRRDRPALFRRFAVSRRRAAGLGGRRRVRPVR